jgi:CRP-like cAMP-binding protein
MHENNQEIFNNLKTHIGNIVDLSQNDFEKITPFFQIRKIDKKQHLILPGMICKFESFIISGLFQTAVIDSLGRPHTLYFPHESWWVGDFKSFKQEKPSDMEILALENSILLQISKPNLEKLYHSVPIMERFFRVLNENAGIALQERISQNFVHNAEKKYQDFVKKYPKIQQRISNKLISSYLGITPEYFSQMARR